jgi:hypothetical protein
MNSYLKDIIPEKTPKVFGAKEEEEKLSLALSLNRYYLITLEDVDLSINQSASERQPALSSTRKVQVPDNFVDSQVMMSDHRRFRAEVLVSHVEKQR